MANIDDSSRSDLLLNGSTTGAYQEYNVKLVNSLYPADVNEDERGENGDMGAINEELEKSHLDARGTWYSRAFSPITPGSLRGSTFTLISSALGAGILSLPKMYANTGLILGTAFLILAGMAALWSMYLLSKSSYRTGMKRYSDAVLNLLGRRWNLVLQIVLIIYVFGALVSYLITLNQFIGRLAGGFGIVSKLDGQAWSDSTSSEYYHTYIVITIIAAASYPLCCIKNLSGLRYLTIFSVFAICYIIITIVWQAPILAANLPSTAEIGWFKISWDSLTSWAVCAFAFTCHVNVFPVISELQHSSQKRATKIFNRCIIVEEIMYLSSGLAGYLSCLDGTPSIFINRDAGNASVGPHDMFMIIGQLAMAANLFLVLPVNLNPCRLQIMILLKKEKNPSALLHYGLTAILLIASAALAMVFPNIYAAFGILGGFFATMLSYTFPALIYLKCTKLRRGHYKKWLVYLIASVTTFMGFFAATVILLQQFGVIESSS